MYCTTIFECEICHRIYNNSNACRECEIRHITPKEIVDYNYSTWFGLECEGTKYYPLTEPTKEAVPRRLTVKFSDGLCRSYELYGTGEGFKPFRTKKSKKNKEEEANE